MDCEIGRAIIIIIIIIAIAIVIIIIILIFISIIEFKKIKKSICIINVLIIIYIAM